MFTFFQRQVSHHRIEIDRNSFATKGTLCFSLFSDLERDLISLRTKEALSAKKAQGQLLGKPKGTLQKSKFDQNVERIKELLSYGLSVRKIARVLGYTSYIALNTYINKRGLHQPVRA